MKNFFEVYNDQKRKDWFAIYINSIVAQFDPHTFYFAPRDKDRIDMTMSGKFEGIGARLNKRNQQIKVVEIISGGPVWKDKLLEIGDAILKVRQDNQSEAISILEMRLSEAVKLIKGDKGTKVHLTVKKVDGSISEVTVKRDIVQLEETYIKSSIVEKGTIKLIIKTPNQFLCSIIVKNRLRHKSCSFSIFFGYISNNVFVNHHIISCVD